MKFTKEFLRESLYGDTTVQDTITDHSRWSVGHERIFKHEGKLYRTWYSVGATENQDESPYEYADNEIECPEVIAVTRTVTVYEPLKEG